MLRPLSWPFAPISHLEIILLLEMTSLEVQWGAWRLRWSLLTPEDTSKKLMAFWSVGRDCHFFISMGWLFPVMSEHTRGALQGIENSVLGWGWAALHITSSMGPQEVVSLPGQKDVCLQNKENRKGQAPGRPHSSHLTWSSTPGTCGTHYIVLDSPVFPPFNFTYNALPHGQTS